MADQNDSNRENLAIVVNSLREANKALRRVIHNEATGVGQVEKLEDKFIETCDKFNQFKKCVQKNDEQAEILKSRLERDIDRQREHAESLKRQIDHLKRSIDDRTIENNKLNHEYTIAIDKYRELKKTSDHQLSTTITWSPSPFIQRIHNEPD
jgi:SMC interacting uncharacterized protein involved in chromosome segregation